MLRQGAAAHLPHLVGRDAELTLLEQRLEATGQGHGSLILIRGEAGIGKTSLAQALTRRAQDKGAAVAYALCYDGSAPAFGLWQDLLTELAASTALDPATLPQPFGAAPPARTAHQLMQSVVGAVRSAAEAPRRYPALVLLLDDVQWADRDSLALTPREVEVLRHVARGATNKDIAEALHISVKTVNAHLTSILAKVDCRTRAAATAFAFQHGLV